MPLQTDQISFDAEINRLEDEREELAEQLARLETGNPAAEQLAEQGQTIDGHLQGLRWARDEAADDENVSVWGEDVDSITLAGLTGGEFGQVEDAVVSDTLASGEDRVGEGSLRVYNVAKGTVEAPYLDDEMNYEQRVGAVSQLPITFLKWAHHRIDDLTSAGGNGDESFASLVTAKQAELDET